MDLCLDKIRPQREGVGGSARSGGWLFLRTVSLRIALLATVAVATALGTDELAGWQVAFTIFSTAAFSVRFALTAFSAGEDLVGATSSVGSGCGWAVTPAARASRAASVILVRALRV